MKQAVIVPRRATPTTLAQALASTISVKRREEVFSLAVLGGIERVSGFTKVVDTAQKRLAGTQIPESSLFSLVRYESNGKRIDKLYFGKPEFASSSIDITTRGLSDAVIWAFFLIEHTDRRSARGTIREGPISCQISTKSLYKSVVDSHGNCDLFMNNYKMFKKHLRVALYKLTVCDYSWVHVGVREPISEEDSTYDSFLPLDYRTAGVDYFKFICVESIEQTPDCRDEIITLSISMQFKELLRRANGTSYTPLLEISHESARAFAYLFYSNLRNRRSVEFTEGDVLKTATFLGFPYGFNFTDRIAKILRVINKAWDTKFRVRAVTKTLRVDMPDLCRHSVYVVFHE